MLWVFVAVAAVVVVVIALVAVGKVSAELAARPQLSVFDLEEAVAYVADRLSPATAGQLSYEDVEALLGWHLDYFESRGVADRRDPRLDTRPDTPADATDEEAPIVTDDDGSLAFVLGRATEAGLDVTDVQVVEVLDHQMAYLRAIGAIGDAA
jgi:hypothetical protein